MSEKDLLNRLEEMIENSSLKVKIKPELLYQGYTNCLDKDYTLEEIEESITLMYKRLESSQGNLTSAMCRLSLPMSLWLLGYAKKLQAKLDQIKESPLHSSWKDKSKEEILDAFKFQGEICRELQIMQTHYIKELQKYKNEK